MNAANDDGAPTYRAKVDQQDGGPASHPGDDSGGDANDVASGGVSERKNDDDSSNSPGKDEAAAPETDVHGETDTVS